MYRLLFPAHTGTSIRRKTGAKLRILYIHYYNSLIIIALLENRHKNIISFLFLADIWRKIKNADE